MAVEDHGFTKEELAALPPAEREALTADYSETEVRLANGGPGIEVDTPEPKVTEKAEEPAKVVEKAAEVATAAPEKAPEKPVEKPVEAPKGAEAPTTEEEEPERAQRLVVAYQAPAVDMKKVEAELDALDKKYEDGEITLRQRDDQRDVINRAVLKAEMSEESEELARKAVWANEIDRFLDAHPAYKTDRHLYGALDREVVRIASADATIPDRKVLQMAHDEVAKSMRVGEPAKAGKDALREAKDKRKPDLSEVPTTLGQLPNAAAQNADADEFSLVDALAAKAQAGDQEASMALERAVAKMTPQQQDRWAQSA